MENWFEVDNPKEMPYTGSSGSNFVKLVGDCIHIVIIWNNESADIKITVAKILGCQILTWTRQSDTLTVLESCIKGAENLEMTKTSTNLKTWILVCFQACNFPTNIIWRHFWHCLTLLLLLKSLPCSHSSQKHPLCFIYYVMTVVFDLSNNIYSI